jgi:hypothetical protein
MSTLNHLRSKYVLLKQIFAETEFLPELITFIGNLLLRLRYELIIDLNNKSLIEDLLTYADRQTSFHHVIYNGLPYYERAHTHSTCEPKTRPHYDPDHCDCDGSCDGDEILLWCYPTIFPTQKDLVKYVIRYDKDYDEEFYHDTDFIDEICEIKPRKILLVGYKSLSVKNIRGKTTDHRGQNHCRVSLVQESVQKKRLITLRGLIDIYYRAKSNKWDKWYELYSGAKIEFDPNEHITIGLNFDHGS